MQVGDKLSYYCAAMGGYTIIKLKDGTYAILYAVLINNNYVSKMIFLFTEEAPAPFHLLNIL